MRAGIIVLVGVISVVLSDVYMQNPRGSNNRLNENTQNRANANRLFDSQNNNAGGYNTGDRLDKDFAAEVRRQYAMQYYASGPSIAEASKLAIEWTNQHGCGENEKLNCNFVIQYMCGRNGTDGDYPAGATRSEPHIGERRFYLRDGTSTTTNNYRTPAKSETEAVYSARVKNIFEVDVDDVKGLHETAWWYDNCKHREANGGLFHADQDLQPDTIGYVTASKTRQNNGGTRRGYECPEERDYYPYWHPTNMFESPGPFKRTPWIDLAWLGDTDRCEEIKAKSFNRNSRFRCVLSRCKNERQYGKSITHEGCREEGGAWVEFVSFMDILDITDETECLKASEKDGRNKIFWGSLRTDDVEKYCIVQAPEVICDKAPTTRVNHNGNGYYPPPEEGDTSPNLNTSRIEIDLPFFPTQEAKRCVLRLRYNITTADYDPFNTFSDKDGEDTLKNDPQLDILGNGQTLKIEINTAQFGRVFQDRSHVYTVLPRKKAMEGKRLYNLNVRGKRGNAEQTYPATEYDFVPDRLKVRIDDLVHIQWTGSNSHDNNNNGAAGQGAAGTDRHNLLEMDDLKKNIPYLIKDTEFWGNVESLTDPKATSEDIAIGLATSGFFCGKTATDVCQEKHSMDVKTTKLDDELDNAPASYFGHVLKFKDTGFMYYMCSRNNAFSNRSQKGALWVTNDEA